MDRKGMTLSQHLKESRLGRDGDLAGLLTTLASAAQRISHEVNRAG